MRDKYPGYEALGISETEGVDFEINARHGASGIAVIAPHGGGIEPGTAEIADAIAGSEHSFYCFKGTKSSGNAELHITSKNFDEPRGLRMVESVDTVIAVHGCRKKDSVVRVGGLNHDLVAGLKQILTRSGFETKKTTTQGLQGISPENICNRCQGRRGAQLEVPETLRRKMFDQSGQFNSGVRTGVFQRFVAAVRSAISIYQGDPTVKNPGPEDPALI